MPYFKKAENNVRGGDEFHGGDGPLNVNDLLSPRPISQAFVEAGVANGLHRTDDFNGILKNEFLLYECTTMSELKQLIDESVCIYNNVRPHLSLDMRTPAEVHGSYLCPA